MGANGELELPKSLLKKLTAGQQVRLVLIVEDGANDNSEADWRRVTEAQFLKGYSPADSIYDDL